jgi:hypothetical protein
MYPVAEEAPKTQEQNQSKPTLFRHTNMVITKILQGPNLISALNHRQVFGIH